jgi:hypothetical protein
VNFKTSIDPATVQAYRETNYGVQATDPFVLRIDKACPELMALHQQHRVDCSAYITACNPFSQVYENEVNAERHAALGRELDQDGLTYVEGIGQHPSNQWPGETSYLMFGLPLDAAKALGSRLGQNAFVWTGADAVPQLILLR